MERYLRPGRLLWLGIGVLLSLILWRAHSNFSSNISGSGSMMALAEFDRTLIVGTDIASLFLYHPDDLMHRWDDPPGWCYRDFAVRKEFADGTLVAFGTGGDGGFLVRVTTGGLTKQEQEHLVGAQRFRLQVRHGQLYLDGGDALPDGGYRLPGGRVDLPPLSPNYDPDLWLTLPNGGYQVTVSTFDWRDRVDSNINPHAYTFEFHAIENLEAIEPPMTFPELLPGEGLLPDEATIAIPSFSFARGVIPLLSRLDVLFPNVDLTLPLTQADYQAISPEILRRSQWAIAVSPNPRSFSLATLVKVEGLREGSFSQSPDLRYRLTGRSQMVVQLLRVFAEGNLQWAEVERFEPPLEAASVEQIASLKAQFATYAEHHTDYPQQVAYPGFYAEEIAALEDARSLGWSVANALILPPEIQQELLALSDRRLLQRLSSLLEEKT